MGVWLLGGLLLRWPLAYAISQYTTVYRSGPTVDGGSPIVVGSSQAMDCCSINSGWGRNTVQAWQLFTSWLTQRGGILVGGKRRPLELRVLDDQSSNDLVRAAYTQHTVKDNMSLLLGPYGTVLTNIAADVANASGALFIAPRASDAVVTKGRPTAFTVTPPGGVFTTCALEALAAKGARTMVFIAENLSGQQNQCGPLRAAGPSFGMNVTYSQIVPANPDKNATWAALDNVRKLSADVVFACMQLPGCLDVANYMVTNAYYPKAVVMPTCTTSPTWTALGEEVLYFTGTVPWLPTMPLRSNLTNWTAQEFSSRFQQAFNEIPAFQSAASFATLELLVVAIEKANSTDVAKVAAQLRTMQLETVYGVLRFDSNRQVDLNFIAVQQTKLNADPPIVSPLAVAQAPMRYPMPNFQERQCLSRVPSEFGYTSEGVCAQCPSGYASVWDDATLTRSCFLCPPGFLYKGNSKCVACPAGKVTITAGQPQCTNCSLGMFTGASGQSACTPCPGGTMGGEEGATACASCTPGKFNSEAQQSNCRDCLAGTFNEERGAFGCRPCAAGSYSAADGSGFCTPCPGGQITVQLGSWSAGACICDKGAYWDGRACRQCPLLQSTDGSGATSKDACSLTVTARDMVAILVSAAVAFPALFCFAWARLKKRLRDAERLRLNTLQHQLESGLKTIKEFQHPMVVVTALDFCRLSDEDLQAAHEAARDKGLLISFDTSAHVAKHRLLNPKFRVVLFSYEWLSWATKGPDRIQAIWMRRALAQYCKKTGCSAADTHVWLDVLSIPQVNTAMQGLAVNSLYTYAASVDALIIIAPSSVHEGSGEKANLASYKMRAWTRMEQVAQIAAHSLDAVFVATESNLEAVTQSWVEDILDIIGGQMTCCRLKHKNRAWCDKESLVPPLLGLWYLLCGGGDALHNSGAALLHSLILPRVNQIFPPTIPFETASGVEQRPLFGDLIPLLEKHMRQQARDGERRDQRRGKDVQRGISVEHASEAREEDAQVAPLHPGYAPRPQESVRLSKVPSEDVEKPETVPASLPVVYTVCLPVDDWV